LLEVQWRARVAWVLIKKQLDEDSGRWLPIILVLTDAIAYALVFLVAFDLVEIHEFRMLIPSRWRWLSSVLIRIDQLVFR